MTAAPRAVRVIVSGVVQGVGFRPFVHRLAREMGVSGSVRNEGGAVSVEAAGSDDIVTLFLQRLVDEAPPLSLVQEVAVEEAPLRDTHGFEIMASVSAQALGGFPSADLAICDTCAEEYGDPSHRLFAYPFISCACCGPRLSILEGVPYDRERTSMAAFPLCDACVRDFRDGDGRRHHAIGMACAECGPTVALVVGGALQQAAIAGAAERLRAGEIGAIKGLGGYQLACDATDAGAVHRLRARKNRPHCPLAIMVEGEKGLDAVADANADERLELRSPARPIVLLRSRAGGLAASVSGKSPLVGVMFPTTGLHLALLRAVDRPLVMTSGNVSDEPMAIDAETAASRLSRIADFHLHHNRTIVTRVDDSVVRVRPGRTVIRRARGLAPKGIRMPRSLAAPALAVGAELKATFAIGVGHDAVASPPMGDLTSVEAYDDLERSIARFERVMGVTPAVLVHDLHPDMLTTRYAFARARDLGVPTLGVQHHHAHVAACAVDAGWNGPVIGVAFDGMGYGLDRAMWGGEFFVGDVGSLRRFAHFRYVPLLGGDVASRDGVRMALVHAMDADIPLDALPPIAEHADLIRLAHLARTARWPLTSSVGRLYDAVACLAGVCSRSSYEGQAACELEWSAEKSTSLRTYPFAIEASSPCSLIDTRPMVRAVVEDVARGAPPTDIARTFHNTLSEIVATVAALAKDQTGISQAALSGGCFANALLVESCSTKLQPRGIEPLVHRSVPPNDAAISLGQLAVCAATGSFGR